MDIKKIKTLGDLKASDYKPKTIKEEMRDNLILKMQEGENVFADIHGYQDTVIPNLERAILSKHNILLLGLRGQAKTRIARTLTQLLDEYIPVVKGSEINDDPFEPISYFAKETIKDNGDKTEIIWKHRDERYIEKLATPDVSVSDLIGDVDPIKAASLKLNYSDERVIHFGLIPRSHRCIFVINELPDLQARIQVSLFNILEEEDLQIRGFTFRFPLDIQFLFTANPEDYTNRGSIVTPLKDRIESQILTHYPKELEIAKTITKQEANIHGNVAGNIHIPEIIRDILERVVFHARISDYIDTNSGVSARMSISAMENLVSTAERRMLLNKEKSTKIRISDFWGIIPSITGKMELVYEGEQMGSQNIALHLIEQAIKETFNACFPDPNLEMKKENDIYGVIRAWFQGGNTVTIGHDISTKAYEKSLKDIEGADKLIKLYQSRGKTTEQDELILKELLMHGLSAHEVISKDVVSGGLNFIDPLAGMLTDF